MKVWFASRRTLLIMVPFLFSLGVFQWAALSKTDTLQGKIIIVDAGHGGVDSGANRPGIEEKNINLGIALKMKNALNRYGAKVVLSRQSDVDLSGECDNPRVQGRYHRDLSARIEMAEESDADLFVSIHANAVNDARRHGAETFYYKKSDAGKVLAEAIQTELNSSFTISHPPQPANYFVLRKNSIPAVLVEVGYITNPEEKRLLVTDDYQQALAEAITKGIFNYYKYE